MTQKFKTWTPKQADLEHADWYLVDATGLTLGRLASNVAKVLKGKHKPTYAPHVNTGDHIIVINAEKVQVTGAKLDDKQYTRYTGYPGGLRMRSLRRQRELDPAVPIREAVRGMLQHNTLGHDQLNRLRVYSGAEHSHQAQQPQTITFNQRGDIERA